MELTPEDRRAVNAATLAQGRAFFTYEETPTYYLKAVEDYLKRRENVWAMWEKCLAVRSNRE